MTRIRAYLSFIALLILLLVASSLGISAQAPGSLTVAFIDVGQGDSALLKTTDGEHILVDAGPRYAGPTVVAYLDEHEVDMVDVVVISHAHADHIGGLVDLFQSPISVGAVIYNGLPCNTTVCAAVWSEMEARGLTPTPAVAAQTHSWGSLDGVVFNPQPTPRGDQNEDSVVMVVIYGETRFLFTGDIGTTTESVLLSEGMSLAADILKVAHHGSRHSSSKD